MANNSDHVQIDTNAINRYVRTFEPSAVDHWMKACPFEYRPCTKVEDEIDRWFLSDALAYCFWGYPTKWTIEYEGRKIDGWWALLASFQRAIEAGTPILNGNYLAQLDKTSIQILFAGEPRIPLFNERLEDLNQIGGLLVRSYGGQFHNYLKGAPKDATKLIFDLAQKFPTFYDVSTYKGEEIFFYKKAQLLVHDLLTGFHGSRYSAITGSDSLTGEADYKVPAILRKLEILRYSDHLSQLVDSRTILTSESSEEIEIRANMLVACDLIVQKLRYKYPSMNARTLDGILWVATQDKSSQDKPYHLTLTRAY